MVARLTPEEAYTVAVRELLRLIRDRGGILMRAEAEHIERRLHDDLLRASSTARSWQLTAPREKG